MSPSRGSLTPRGDHQGCDVPRPRLAKRPDKVSELVGGYQAVVDEVVALLLEPQPDQLVVGHGLSWPCRCYPGSDRRQAGTRQGDGQPTRPEQVGALGDQALDV